MQAALWKRALFLACLCMTATASAQIPPHPPGTVCFTPYTWCFLPQTLPVGAPCGCSTTSGVALGRAG